MMANLPIKKENEIVYGEVVNDKEIQQFINDDKQLTMMMSGINQQTDSLNRTSQNAEYATQRYLTAEANKQWIRNNENNKYYDLVNKQNNLLDRVNHKEIKLWRHNKDKLHYRTSNGQLIIDKNIEIQKELSSRHGGGDIYFVNDMNDALKNNNQMKVNTIFIAINNIPVVEEEIFDLNVTFELLQYPNGVWKRNLLAYTRYGKNSKYQTNHEQKYSNTRLVMQHIIKNDSNVITDSISQWIGNIGPAQDRILLLVGNCKVSEDLVVNKTIQALFDNGIVAQVTGKALAKQSFEEIVRGKLFLYINYVSFSEEEQKKLKELIISIVIHKSIVNDGRRVSTQAKIIVTVDEPNIFFKDLLEVSTTLFIDSQENILKKFQVTSTIPLYQGIEASLDSYSDEIRAMPKGQLDIRVKENQRYLESLVKENNVSSTVSENGIPTLDPFNDSFNTLVQNHNRVHSLILGGSGAGKTEQIKTMIYCDILREDGSVLLIDPHGDFAKDIFTLPIDPNRIVFIDPALKDDMTPTLNIFDNEYGMSEKDIKLNANIIISVTKAINDEDKFSSSMKEMLYHCICVLLRKGNSSFKELFYFMNDRKNKHLVELGLQSPNELDREYFEDYFMDGNSNKTKDALRRRLKTLLSDHYFSNLVNGKSTFKLEALMNTKGKVIIFNVNKYNMPEHYGYFARFIIELIQKIALNREKIPKEERKPTYCYIDEGQNFITPKIEDLLTGVRKYNIRMNFAFQSILQVKNHTTRNVIATNTNIKFFGKDDNVAEIFSNILTKEAINNIPNLDAGSFYLKANNQDLLLMQNSDKLLDNKIDISQQELEDLKQKQLIYYRAINTQTKSKPTKEELMPMIQQFKSDIIAKNLSESSCLYKLKTTAPERFAEIESDFEYTTRDKKYRPRMRRPEINTIFKLAFELKDITDNADFIQMLKGDSDMFEQASAGARLKKFGDSSGSEQYYYFEQE